MARSRRRGHKNAADDFRTPAASPDEDRAVLPVFTKWIGPDIDWLAPKLELIAPARVTVNGVFGRLARVERQQPLTLDPSGLSRRSVVLGDRCLADHDRIGSIAARSAPMSKRPAKDMHQTVMSTNIASLEPFVNEIPRKLSAVFGCCAVAVDALVILEFSLSLITFFLTSTGREAQDILVCMNTYEAEV